MSLSVDVSRETSSEPQQERPELFLFDPETRRIVRVLTRRDGTKTSSAVQLPEGCVPTSDLSAEFDIAWLRQRSQPVEDGYRKKVRTVDLFSGCGGLTIGVAEACRALDLRLKSILAVDTDAAALSVYQQNIPTKFAECGPIEALIDSEPGAPLSEAERSLQMSVKRVDLLVGGPPCQGHSDLNNRTRRNDPKNGLYLKMARFAEVCAPAHIIIENVRGVQYDSEAVLDRTQDHLRSLGYHVDAEVVRSDAVGVPQARPRVLLIASRNVAVTVRDVVERYRVAKPRPFNWACDDLVETDDTAPFDRPATPKAITRERIDYLFDFDRYELPNHMRPKCHQDGHTYPSVYGRIRGDEPAPTITSGFMTMGQGRFVHPTERRTLTPHEGARIQCFPDWFDFGVRSRSEYVRLIGNAVPPKLAYVAAVELLR